VLIAIISDTHLRHSRRQLPASCVERLRRADLIVHAGDLVVPSALSELRSLGRVLAVHGNVDDEEVRAALPEAAEFESDGVVIAVIHDAGARTGRLARLRKRFPAADAVIFGHSHLPCHEASPEGFQIFNPGSPTDRRRAPHHTMGMARVANGRISFKLVELD
jgi:putative phosphoesterase